MMGEDILIDDGAGIDNQVGLVGLSGDEEYTHSVRDEGASIEKQNLKQNLVWSAGR